MEKEMNKFELLKQIMAIDFVIEDLHLYLNTHPSDKEALARYNSAVMQSQMLRQEYERNFGMLSEHGTPSPYPWQWINEPWPWEYEANFKLSGEEI